MEGLDPTLAVGTTWKGCGLMMTPDWQSSGTKSGWVTMENGFLIRGTRRSLLAETEDLYPNPIGKHSCQTKLGCYRNARMPFLV